MAQQLAHMRGVILPQSKVFDDVPDESGKLISGVSLGFPILGIKSGKWHYRFKGEDNIIKDDRNNPAAAIEVVILNAQAELSRTFYAGDYVEGANQRPDCWSANGVKPDSTVENPVNPVCATCPNARWGSGATATAPKAQACQQRRRLAVVPYSPDLTNESGGGPILLSIPPGSLTNQVSYGKMLKAAGAHFSALVTRLSFDQDPRLAFPRIEFEYVKPLSDDECNVILSIRNGPEVENILNSQDVEAADASSAAPQPTQEPPKPTPASPAPASPAPASPAPSPRPTTATAHPSGGVKAPVVKTAPAPAQQAPAKAPAPAPVVGGFAVKATTAAPPASEPGINEALAKPAAMPASQRKVATPPVASTIKTMAPAVEEPEAEPEDNGMPVGSAIDAMNDAFASLSGVMGK